MHKMADETGLDDIHRLVYAPASSELHGEWASLKEYYLTRCANPLHRFHWVPDFASQSKLESADVATAMSLLSETLNKWNTIPQLPIHVLAPVVAVCCEMMHVMDGSTK